nr:hypothetical protein [Tanacetum cinerariifolium]
METILLLFCEAFFQKLKQFKLVWNTLGLDSLISAIVADALLIAKGQAYLELSMHNTEEVPASLIEDKHIKMLKKPSVGIHMTDFNFRPRLLGNKGTRWYGIV